ncbi:hypothetical protein PENTCL1PPCAC_25043 [Pristionchus entomophagus]|uniref:Uncharacterized protein n=1 Tax=Pristionchus entomophagus TaxID=358040 RepID=A0AAV5U7N8_9BILA|nr:hypothetical protein PENTCL1PPCAC_25043 [Pristionchus entomophagus]
MPAVLTRSTTSGTYSTLNNSHCVLLLGWGGADDKCLKKYADLYETRGLDTVRFTSEFKAFSAQGLSGLRDMNEIFPLLDQIGHRRLVLHIFSMNGICSLVTLLHHAKYSDLFTRTDAVVWDSCPTYERLIPNLISYNRVINHLHKNALESGSFIDKMGCLADKTVRFSWDLLEALRQWVHVATGGSISAVHPYFYVRDHPQLPRRHTIIYSHADVVCKAPLIQTFHRHLSEKRNMIVEATCFNDSPHVTHLKAHPKEYSQGIEQLLDFVVHLNDNQSGKLQSKL